LILTTKIIQKIEEITNRIIAQMRTTKIIITPKKLENLKRIMDLMG